MCFIVPTGAAGRDKLVLSARESLTDLYTGKL